MKSKWQFDFETKDFIFNKEHKFKGSAQMTAVSNELTGDVEVMEFELNIVPDKELKRPTALQTGIMYITVPGDYNETKNMARTLAYSFSQRISLEFGKVEVLNGIIVCERIPETPEEINMVGDKTFALEFALEEVGAMPTFDAQKFIEQSAKPLDTRLVSQYNVAMQALNPVEKFLGLFKIIETLFVRKKRVGFKDAFLSNMDLFDLFVRVFHFDDAKQSKVKYEEFINRIVSGRHKCAHMKLRNGFGYWAHDPKIRDEISPTLYSLEILAFSAIHGCDK